MRGLVLLGLAVAIVLAVPAPAIGQPAAPAPAAEPAHPDDDPIPMPPPSRMRQPEILQHKPSGFRMSNAPARGGAYRYRLLGVGVIVVAISAFLTIRFLRKAGRARQAR